MGLIKLGNEVIPDRRTNGARIKLDISDWFKVASVIIVLILAGGNLKWTVNAHSEILTEQAKTIKLNNEIIISNCKDIEFLKKSFEKIDNKLERILNVRK